MTDQQPEPDLEYDLAHEASEVATPLNPHADQGPVATTTPEYDGDYSYDLAHDVPPAG